jgi:hypothetical protein
MPSGDLTQAKVGVAVPLCYGYVRATGNCAVYKSMLASDPTYPNMQIGAYLLGEGEWDGPDTLFINNSRMFAYDRNGNRIGPDPTTGTIDGQTSPLVGTMYAFTFHPGTDATGLGSDTKQFLDTAWSFFDGMVNSMYYSRLAYYFVAWTPQVNSGVSQMTPIADWRTTRCRIFDGDGNQTDYRFTTNPIWHMVDAYLRRAVKPFWGIDYANGPDTLTTDEANCFRWDIIAESAAYCDEILSNGAPRFQGSYAFSSGTTLAAMIEQMLLVCRGYQQEIAGKIAFFVDQPRSSLFTVTADHLMPNTFVHDETILHQNANRYTADYLELGLPAISQIATISRSSGTVSITTVTPNPAAAEDLIIVGGVADPSFDQAYSVAAVTGATITAPGASGSSSSTGGCFGYLESRFTQRTVEAPPHVAHQKAMGQMLPPSSAGTRLRRVKVNYNYASTTWDQAMRLLLYERYRDLGADATPYKPPIQVTVQLWSEAVDSAGNILKQRVNGDRITLDPTVFFEYAGDYEIMQMTRHPMQVDPQQQGGSSITQPTTDTGTIVLLLRTYDEAAFIDESGIPDPSFATVPGEFLYSGGTSGTYTIAGGEITITSPEGVDIDEGYTASVSWTAVRAIAPNGNELIYTDGSGGLIAGGNGSFIISDPTYVGGALISVYSQGDTLPDSADIQYRRVIRAPGPGSTERFILG